MISTWLITGIILVLLFLFLIYGKQGGMVKLILLVIIGLFLYVAIAGVFTSEKVDFSTPKGAMNAAVIYFSWMGQTVSGLWDVSIETAHVVGNAIKVDKDEDKKKDK